MHYKICFLEVILIIASCKDKPVNRDVTIHTTTKVTTILKPGFYIVTSAPKSPGTFPLINSNEYYSIGLADVIDLKNVDSIKKEYNKLYDFHLLKMIFNEEGKNQLEEIKHKYKAQLGLLIDNQIIALLSTMKNGSLIITSVSEKVTDMQLITINKELEKLKRQ